MSLPSKIFQDCYDMIHLQIHPGEDKDDNEVKDGSNSCKQGFLIKRDRHMRSVESHLYNQYILQNQISAWSIGQNKAP